MSTHEPQAISFLKPHISINVRNVEASVEFYRRMLGIEPAKVRTGYAKFDVHHPPLNLAMNETPDLEGPGALSHLGLQVSSTDDVIALRDRWSEAGLISRDEMNTDCCYATQNKAWVTDPDGNEWEVFTILIDDLPESSASTGTCCSTSTASGACGVES